MRKTTGVVAPLLATVMGLLAAPAAQALDFDHPFFGGGYAPPPAAPYGGYAQIRVDDVVVRGRVRMVRYDQGFYYGGYQYPAGGYGGGLYRRAAYSAADVYVGLPPCPVYRAAYAPRRSLRARCACQFY
jgi:hypothetical protein